MTKDISIIGIPMDLGQSRRGVDMGPSAIRYAGAVERLEALDKVITDLGDILVESPKRGAQEDKSNLKNIHQVKEANEKLAQMVNREIHKGQFPIDYGGD